MSEIVISVRDVWKQYRLGDIGSSTFRDDIKNAWGWITGKHGSTGILVEENDRTKLGSSDFVWALSGVDFDVKKGEVMGIIGKNGAGKSTLLKILSRVTQPTKGEVRVKGRIASLLEVGTGFHPDLTGRENIFMNGSVLGMRTAEIKRHLDEIIAFSGVERYIDTPVKRYSSGMYLRLAFAVAAHLDPEILILDEVLAVGDADFQKKCLGKMQDVSVNHGRTVLFVSHNLQAISTMTSHSILLRNGKMVMNGKTSEVVQEYLADNRMKDMVYSAESRDDKPVVIRIELETSEPANVHIHGKSLRLKFTISNPKRISKAALSFQVINMRDVPIIHSWLFDSDRAFMREPGVYELVCEIPQCRLYMGKYTLNVHLASDYGAAKYETIIGACPFEIVMFGQDREYKWVPETCAYIEDTSWDVFKK